MKAIVIVLLMLGVSTAAVAADYTVAVTSGDDVGAAVEEAIALAGGLEGVVARGDTVLLKPNAVIASVPKTGENTSPEVLGAVVRAARAAGAARVIIAEASGGAQTHNAYQTNRYYRMAAEVGADLVDLNYLPSCRKTIDSPFGHSEYFMPNLLFEVDAVIDVPVLKSHFWAGITCCCKNLVGVIPSNVYYLPKWRIHDYPISDFIADINRIVRPDFCVADATRILAGRGPAREFGGFPYHMGVVLAGRNAVAVDRVGCSLLGIPEADAAHLTLLAQVGAGPASISEVKVVGEPIEVHAIDTYALEAKEALAPTGDLMSEVHGAEVPAGTLRVWWLGQAGFVCKTHVGTTFAVDPYLSNSVNDAEGMFRLERLPLAPSDLTVDYCFLTHDHLDHTDPETVRAMAANTDAVFVGPPSVAEHVTGELGVTALRMVTLARGGERRFADDLRAKAVHAEHTDDSVGFIFEAGGVSFYVSGDSLYCEELEGLAGLQPDAMAVCINGRAGNMSCSDAARLTGLVRPGLVIPMHHGMFAENTADPHELADELRALGISGRVEVMEFKGSLDIAPRVGLWQRIRRIFG